MTNNTISRNNSLELIKKHCDKCEKDNCTECPIKVLEDNLMYPEQEVVVVDKPRKPFKGCWIKHKYFAKYECSRCGNRVKKQTKYCNKCGSIMNIKEIKMQWD